MNVFWQWFLKLDFAKILWVVFALIAVISLIEAFQSKGENGGYGTGVILGMVVAGFWNPFPALKGSLSGGLILLCVVGIYSGGLCIGGYLLTQSQKWMSRYRVNAFLAAAAVLFRIIAVTIFSFLFLNIIFSVGNGGIIVY